MVMAVTMPGVRMAVFMSGMIVRLGRMGRVIVAGMVMVSVIGMIVVVCMGVAVGHEGNFP